MIKRIRLKFGPTPDQPPVEFKPGPMTVIVGPNNSGKSLTLKELHRSLEHGDDDWQGDKWKVLAEIEPELPATGELRSVIEEEVRKDFHPLRETKKQDDLHALLSLIGAAGLRDMSPALIEAAHHILELFNKKKAVETLVAAKKLNFRIPPKPVDGSQEVQALPGNIDRSIQEKISEIAEMLKTEHSALIGLIDQMRTLDERKLVESDKVNLRGYFRLYRNLSVLLDGKARLELPHREKTRSLWKSPTGTLMKLRENKERLRQFRHYVHDAFDQHIAIDLFELNEAKLVLFDKAPPDDIEDHLDDRTKQIFSTARDLSEFSDGVRTYVGLHAYLLSEDRKFIMLDEPEAFLHPPLARRLGSNLTTLAAQRGACVFAATHSPDFLMGCIDAGVGVNIIRLSYRNGRATAHLLPREDLQEMMLDPLLRSTGMLGALFHQAAVVVEGDSDRAFYGEINERLRVHEPEQHPRIMRDCVFLNAQGKQNVSRIFGALRRLGVAATGIIDLDLLKDQGTSSDLFRESGAPESVSKTIGVLRGNVRAEIKDIHALCAPLGLKQASEDEKKAVSHFIREMEACGVFIPPVSVLEGWLSDLGVKVPRDKKDKKAWILEIFQKMGRLDTGLKPSKGDVWDFMRRIGQVLERLAFPVEDEGLGLST